MPKYKKGNIQGKAFDIVNLFDLAFEKLKREDRFGYPELIKELNKKEYGKAEGLLIIGTVQGTYYARAQAWIDDGKGEHVCSYHSEFMNRICRYVHNGIDYETQYGIIKSEIDESIEQHYRLPIKSEGMEVPLLTDSDELVSKKRSNSIFRYRSLTFLVFGGVIVIGILVLLFNKLHSNEKSEKLIIDKDLKFQKEHFRFQAELEESSLLLSTIKEMPLTFKGSFPILQHKTLKLPFRYFSTNQLGGICTIPCDPNVPWYSNSSLFNLDFNLFDTSLIMFSSLSLAKAIPYDTNNWVNHILVNSGDTVTTSIYFHNVGDTTSKNTYLQLSVQPNIKHVSNEFNITATILASGPKGKVILFQRASKINIATNGYLDFDSSNFIYAIEEKSKTRIPYYQHPIQIFTTGINIGDILPSSYGCLLFQFFIKPKG